MENSNRSNKNCVVVGQMSRKNRYKPSELSDRIMGLNRMEAKNLENRLKLIDKESRVSLGFINRDIKHLEQEAEIQRKLVESFNQSAKLKLLNSHLHMVLLNERKLEDDLKRFKMTEELVEGSIKESKVAGLPRLPSVDSALEPVSKSANILTTRRVQSAKPNIETHKSSDVKSEIYVIEEQTSRNFRKTSNDPLKLFEKRIKESRKSLTQLDMPKFSASDMVNLEKKFEEAIFYDRNLLSIS